MKKRTRIISMLVALTLVVSLFSGTAAFADEADPTNIVFTDGFDAVTQVELNSVGRYELQINKPELTLSAASSDEAVLTASLKQDKEDPGVYKLTLMAWSEGEADITVTASDGTTVTQTVTVADTGAERTYTISSDTTEDFSLAKGSSKIIKVHYEDYDHFSYPVVTTDDQENSLITALIYSDYDNNDYYFRVDAIGDVGATGQLYIGSSDYIPDKLCKVTVNANKNLSLDTSSTYVCNLYDTYRFVVRTGSPTQPVVTSFNDMLDVELIGKVNGGYEYSFQANEVGDSLIQATVGGEEATFQVHVNYNDPPTVKSDTGKSLNLAQGSSYTYKFSIMGGGEPEIVPSTSGVFTTQITQKDGIDYYCKVTAVGQPGSSSDLMVNFPQGGDESFNVNAGTITVTKPQGIVMKSDTNSDFSVKKGASYTFEITGATSFNPGSAGVFKTEKVGTGKNGGTLYKITAIGNPGQQAGFYMSVAGQPAQKVCVVTIAAPDPVVMKSDTTHDFSVKKGASYTFEITGATSFNPGTSGVFKTEQVGKTASGTLYKITAIGNPGQQAGFYMSVAGQPVQKVCVVTIAAPDPVVMKSDTTHDFSVKKGASYTFEITGATSFNPGTSGVFKTEKVGTGKNGGTLYKITAIGNPGQQAGFYMSVAGQPAQKVCVVTVS